jgi:uncharacterized membrane protein YbhN (UPF0104 family)
MKSNYKRWLIWLGLVISAVFLYLAFREINYAELWRTLQAGSNLVAGCRGW